MLLQVPLTISNWAYNGLMEDPITKDWKTVGVTRSFWPMRIVTWTVLGLSGHQKKSFRPHKERKWATKCQCRTDYTVNQWRNSLLPATVVYLSPLFCRMLFETSPECHKVANLTILFKKTLKPRMEKIPRNSIYRYIWKVRFKYLG